MARQQPLSYGQVHRSLVGLFDGDMHAKRIASLANATLGVVKTGSLAVSTIGHGLALARGLTSKHAIKQVDRLLSNEGIDIDAALCHWVRYVVGPRTSINVAMDWTEFDADGQATLMLSLLTSHGRATPLLWLTVDTSTLKNHRNEYEYQVLVRLADALPSYIKVCIVADRGFGDQKLYPVLSEELKFDYVIRFRGNIQVTASDGEMRTAAAWVGAGGRARVLRDALVTAECYQVGSVLCVQDKAMKQAWCLATSGTDQTANALISLYSKRWSIECSFRDTKDLRFGMGMASIHLSTPARRDRLAPIHAFAIMLLTLLGCRRGTWVPSIPQVKHYQAAHSLAVSAGLHTLRSDPQYARSATVAADRAVRRYARRASPVCPYFRRGVDRGLGSDRQQNACHLQCRTSAFYPYVSSIINNRM